MHTLLRHSHRPRHAPGAPFLLPFRRLPHTRDDLPHLVRRKPSLAPPARSVFQPPSPCSSKRRDQVDTVVRLTPNAPATSASLAPSARRRTMRARRPSRWLPVLL